MGEVSQESEEIHGWGDLAGLGWREADWRGAAREGERPGGERDSSRGWGRARRREETEVAAAAAARQP